MEAINYRKILITHDGSQLASAVLPYAVAFAKACKAEVLLLQVIESFTQETIHMTPVSIGHYPLVVDIAKDKLKEHKRIAKQQLEQIKKLFEEQGITTVKIYVRDGFTRDVILDVAKNEHCNLIVMATRGRSGLGRVLLGSVADYVIRHADCPVLTVHPKKEDK